MSSIRYAEFAIETPCKFLARLAFKSQRRNHPLVSRMIISHDASASQANEVARKSQVPSQAPTTGVKAKVANPKPVVKEVDDSFTCCGLFSRKKAEAYAAPAVSTTTSKDTAQAIADISRRSRQVQQTNAVARASGKSTSLMDEITDQVSSLNKKSFTLHLSLFHRP